MISPAVGYMVCHNVIKQNKRNRENTLKSNIKTVHTSSISNSNLNKNLSDTPKAESKKTESTITQEDMKVYWQQIEMAKNLMKILNPELDI